MKKTKDKQGYEYVCRCCRTSVKLDRPIDELDPLQRECPTCHVVALEQRSKVPK